MVNNESLEITSNAGAHIHVGKPREEDTRPHEEGILAAGTPGVSRPHTDLPAEGGSPGGTGRHTEGGALDSPQAYAEGSGTSPGRRSILVEGSVRDSPRDIRLDAGYKGGAALADRSPPQAARTAAVRSEIGNGRDTPEEPFPAASVSANQHQQAQI